VAWMRILIVLHKMKKKGGMVLQHLKMSKQFEKNGCEVKIFSFDDYFITRNVFFNYLKIYRILRKTIRKFNPEIILTSDPYFTTLFSLLVKQKNISLVMRVGAIYHPFYAGRIIEKISPRKMYIRLFYFINFLLKQLDKLILQQCNYVIFNSNFLKEYYEKYTASSSVIYNGIEKITTKIPHYNTPVNLVYVGRIEPRKSIEIIFKSLFLIKKQAIKFHFSLIGNNNQSSGYWLKLSNLIKSYNLIENITIFGEILNKDLPAILEKQDILLFSTDDRNFPITEGLPNAILEGMANGLAIIATNVAGVSEILHEENGFTINPNPIELAEKIMLLIENKNLLVNIKKINIETVQKKYRIELVSKLYLKNFEKLIKSMINRKL